MKIAGIWNGHDCSFCILENGYPTIHAELERYTREKEPPGDSYKFFKELQKTDNDIDHWITCEETHLITEGRISIWSFCRNSNGNYMFR